MVTWENKHIRVTQQKDQIGDSGSEDAPNLPQHIHRIMGTPRGMFDMRQGTRLKMPQFKGSYTKY